MTRVVRFAYLSTLLAVALVAQAPASAAEPESIPAEECVSEVAKLPAYDLAEIAFLKRGDFKLSARKGCLVVDGGGYPAGLFSLPAFEEPYAVRVAAQVEPGFGGANAKAKVVSPRVTLLDEKLALTRTFGASDLTRRGAQMSIDVFVNPENSAERYLLLHVEPERVGETETRSNVGATVTPIYTGVGFVVITTGHDKPQQIEVRAKGRFVVSLLGDWADRARKTYKARRKD